MRLAPLLYKSPGHIRSRLFRDLVLLVCGTLGFLFLVGWVLIGELKHDLAEAQLTSAITLVRNNIRRLIDPVEQQLLITRDGLRSAKLTPTDRKALYDRFQPIMLHMSQVAGAVFADDSGAEYFLMREDGKWMERNRPPGDGVAATWTRRTTEGEQSDARSEPLDYDPRGRPWFTAALKANEQEVVWSKPYIFHSLQVPGITAAVAWKDESVTRVVALDVVLRRVIAVLDELPLGNGGRGFLFGGNGAVYVPSPEGQDPTGATGSQFFSASQNLGGPLLFDAVAAWEAAGHPAEHLIPFRSQGSNWWGDFLPVSQDPDAAWIGIALPASETLGVLQNRWQILAFAALAVVAVAVGLALVLMRKYSRQLRDLPKLAIDRASYQNDLYDLIRNGEDMHLELKSTMRTNLHTGKPGKEIELAWLKGAAAFMNTEGGILLLGVADDGSVVGLDEDKFENDDKCRLHFKNLLNQHLGAENARFAHFDLYTLEGKRIAAVECERADLPVYLRNKDAESFLIRNGPSNIELSTSRAVKYIRGRF